MAFVLDSRQVAPIGWHARARLRLPTGWTAPVLFGGMAMACALRVAELSGPRGMVPLTASATFHRPLEPGPVTAHWTELAQTRRTRTVQTRLEEQLTVVGSFTRPGELTEAARLGTGPTATAPERLRPAVAERPGTAAAALAEHVDWRVLTPWTERTTVGEILAWIAPRRVPWIAGGYLDPLWYCVAADLLGPALYAGAPFRIATLTLELQVLGLTRSRWLLQRVVPDTAGPWAGGRIELWDRAGRLVATGSQRARLLPAEDADLPWSVTAFGAGHTRLVTG